ncbi:MAG: ADP-ribosylglycohydrolase family protein [Verrucomicrobiota bacterium]|nr:ADP-ribosylglycohydrolase family protein [Verrucomicrobiota bacterium]
MSFQNAFLGSLVADAISMPVHWYYDRNKLDRDYPGLSGYSRPKNPHPDSILWRSSYNSTEPKSDILHGQKKYWGQREIHYHQHLNAGENTLNLQLSAELYRQIILNGEFSIDHWLHRYAEVMLTPGWHNDTYIEEYHRAFFQNYGKGKPLRSCGVKDFHIGSLSLLPGLLAGLEAIEQTEPAFLMECALTLVRSTHDDEKALRATTDLVRILIHLLQSGCIQETVEALPLPGISSKNLRKWASLDDRLVVGEKLSTACYLPDSFLASVYLSWKYHDNFQSGVIANARVGGDNCHRGVVVGSILGLSTGIPKSLLVGLKMMNRLRCDAQLVERPQLLKRAS